MPRQKIDTAAVVSAASNLRTYNAQIRDEISRVENAVSRLDAGWDGTAATNAIRAFRNIKNSYHSARYKALDNCVTYLTKQVGAGYEKTEEKNASLADRFK